MARRAYLSFFPAALLALAFLFGTPGATMGGLEASAATSSATSWSAPTASAPVARGNLTLDFPDGAINPRADQDDTPDDRILRVVTAIIWPATTLEARLLDTVEHAGPSHPPCAAPPRAPPTA
jgi:hypothetical protein